MSMYSYKDSLFAVISHTKGIKYGIIKKVYYILEYHIATQPLNKAQVSTNRLLCFDKTRTGYKTTRPTILLLLRVYLL
jgi:hypothetical protein